MTYLLIHNGTLIDGTGGSILPNAAILIEDNQIVSVGTEDSFKLPNAKITKIDVGGNFILPGFIDAHIHLMANGFKMEDNMYTSLSLYFYKAIENMHRTIEAGVTTVRDAGLADIGVKTAVQEGLITGPRMQISVTPLSISGGHFDFWLNSGFDMKISYPGFPCSVCDGIEEVRRRVREVLRAGADVIKVMATGGVMSANDSPEFTQFSVEELETIVQEGEYHSNKKVMAHAHGIGGIKNALKAGIHSIEHATYLDDEAIQMMLEQETYLVPTFVAIKVNKESAEAGQLPDYSIEDSIKVADVHEKNMKRAYESGVRIAMGTDCGVVEHGINLQELGFLCDIGMKPSEAIVAGTKTAAECLGWEDKVGTVEEGKFADIVISKTDPIADIKSLGNPDNIVMVMKEGNIVKNLFNI